jgi:tetratricopeptide (TPR) repeat protein/DNA-binding CsgD family transcriptional regulator
MRSGFLGLILLPFLTCIVVGNIQTDSLEARLAGAGGQEKFNILMELAKNYSRIDLIKSLDFAEQAHQFALSSQNPDWIANSLNGLAIINYNRGDNYSALDFFSQFIRIIEEQQRKYPDSLKYASRFITGYNNIGNIYRNLGEQEKAMKAFTDALNKMDSIPEGIQNISLRINLMNNLGTVYTDLGEFDKANAILEKALSISREKEMDLAVSITLNNLGLVAIEQKDFSIALEDYLEAIEIGKKLNDSIALGGYFNNIGLIYEKQEMWAKALGYYQTSLSISRNLGYQWGIANTLANIGMIQTKNNQYPEASKNLNEALKIAQTTGIKDLIQKIYLYLFDLYQRQDMPSNALKYHILYSQVKDSIFNEERSRQIAEMETKYETAQKEKENELLKKNIEIRKTHQKLFIVVIIGLIVLSVLLFMLVRIRTRSLNTEKKIRQLASEKNDIEKKRLEEQIFAEQQINRLQQEKLEQKNRELSTNVMHIMNKNHALREILQHLKEINYTNDTNKDQCLKKVSSLIKNNLSFDNDWEQFKLHFQGVHPSFFKALQNKYPHLSSNEFRLCAYLKINLNSKEIAQMLNVTTDSVIKSRYRLRKKLELDTETDLVEFLRML